MAGLAFTLGNCDRLFQTMRRELDIREKNNPSNHIFLIGVNLQKIKKSHFLNLLSEGKKGLKAMPEY